MKKILLLVLIIATLVGCTTESDLHDTSVEIEGKDMKYLSVQEVADLWEIESELLLESMILEFDLQEEYTVNSILEDVRAEYPFSPAIIKVLAEDIKFPEALDE